MTDSVPPEPTRSRRKGEETRARLVAAARATVHERGVEHSTLGDVARAAGVPLGNLYYYFKTKDDLMSAVLEEYDGSYVMLESLMSKADDPGERLKVLVGIWLSAKERITLYGCPIGTLSSELAKRDPADEVGGAAGVVLGKLVILAQGQFEEMGRADARALALQMVGAYEGAALLSHTLRDPQILEDAAGRLVHWIDEVKAA